MHSTETEMSNRRDATPMITPHEGDPPQRSDVRSMGGDREPSVGEEERTSFEREEIGYGHGV